MVSSNPSDKGTKRSHTVWRAYLKEFASENKLYIKSKEDGKIFRTATENASVVKNIYELDKKISKNDLELYKAIYFPTVKMHIEESKFLNKIIAFLNNDIEFFMGETSSPLNDVLLRSIDKSVLKRNPEELFTYYEENFLPIHKLLLQKNASFYNNSIYNCEAMGSVVAVGIAQTSLFLFRKIQDLVCRLLNQKDLNDLSDQGKQDMKNACNTIEDKLEQELLFYNKTNSNMHNFIIFITSQIARTQKSYTLQTLLEKLIIKISSGKNINCNAKNILALICHHGMYQLCDNLIAGQYKIIFVTGTDNLEFITSDCPIINLYAQHKEAAYLDKNELEFYYPLSPQLAMLFSNRECYKDVAEFQASPRDVFQFNQAIYNESYKHVYSKNEDSLISLK